MSFSPKDPLLRFVLWTLVWLPVFFTLWYLLAPLLLAPLTLIGQALLTWLYPDQIESLGLQGHHLQVLTRLPFTLPDGRTGLITLDVNILKYTYNLPLLMALLFATQDRHFSANRLIVCYLALLPFQLWGLVFEVLMQLGFRAGPDAARQMGLDGPIKNLLALGYQFGVLMLPAISATAIWLALNRDFIASLIQHPRQQPPSVQ